VTNDFSSIAAGASIFLDANTFILHFTAHARFGRSCTELIERIDRQEIQGFTSTHVLGEMAHRLMTIEASQLFGWPFQGIAYRLRQHPVEVQRLTRFQQAVNEVLASRIRVLPIVSNLLSAAALVSRQTGLLSNDALIVAVMQADVLTNLASSDSDFDRVPGLTRYEPT
jgi:predicted nucleic acid-binding protein